MEEKEDLKSETSKKGLKREVEWFLFNPNILALILMFFYGYTLALIGTGYEFRAFVVSVAVLIALFIVMVIELITNIVFFRNKKETNIDETFVEDKTTNEQFVKDTDDKNAYYVEEDPSDAYRTKKEREYDERKQN